MHSWCFAINYIRAYRAARHHPVHSSPQMQTTCWQPPDYGEIKFNFDASVCTRPPSVGLGVVARDSNGQVLAWSRQRLPFIQEPEVAELMAAHLAINLAQQLQVRRIVIGGDFSNVIRDLQGQAICLSAAGGYIQEIRNLVPAFDYVKFCYVSRVANVLDQSLARTVRVNDYGGSDLPSDVMM